MKGSECLLIYNKCASTQEYLNTYFNYKLFLTCTKIYQALITNPSPQFSYKFLVRCSANEYMPIAQAGVNHVISNLSCTQSIMSCGTDSYKCENIKQECPKADDYKEKADKYLENHGISLPAGGPRPQFQKLNTSNPVSNQLDQCIMFYYKCVYNNSQPHCLLYKSMCALSPASNGIPFDCYQNILNCAHNDE